MSTEKRTTQLAKLRTQEAHNEALKQVLKELDSVDLDNIGMIDGTALAKALKLTAHLFPKSGKFIEIPELVEFITYTIRRMPQFAKGD